MIYTDKTAITISLSDVPELTLFSLSVIKSPKSHSPHPTLSLLHWDTNAWCKCLFAWGETEKTYSVPRTLWSVCDLHSQMPTGQWVYRVTGLAKGKWSREWLSRLNRRICWSYERDLTQAPPPPAPSGAGDTLTQDESQPLNTSRRSGLGQVPPV